MSPRSKIASDWRFCPSKPGMWQLLVSASRGPLPLHISARQHSGVPLYQSRFLGSNRKGIGQAHQTKKKHRPNRQKLSKKCPKICAFSPPPDNFGGHFSDILSTFSLCLVCPTICPLQDFWEGKRHITINTFVR